MCHSEGTALCRNSCFPDEKEFSVEVMARMQEASLRYWWLWLRHFMGLASAPRSHFLETKAHFSPEIKPLWVWLWVLGSQFCYWWHWTSSWEAFCVFLLLLRPYPYQRGDWEWHSLRTASQLIRPIRIIASPPVPHFQVSPCPMAAPSGHHQEVFLFL